MRLNLIYSKNNQNIIGIDNELLFNIPEDIKFFKQITTYEYIKGYRNIVIMGYNTWKSIPDKYKPLENRINIVITKNHYNDFKSDTGIFLIFNSMDKCYKFLSNQESIGMMLGRKFIIGGAELYNNVYKNYYNNIDCVYETYINKSLNLENMGEFNIKYLNFKLEEEETFTKLANKFLDEVKSNVNISDEFVLYDERGIYINIYQNNFCINDGEKEYLDLMRSILYKNNIKDSRNSKVISSFGEKMVFDLRDGFPLLTTKRMPFKTILRELLWFIKGSTNNNELNEKNVHIWDANASSEFLRSRGLNYEEGELGPIYGFQWRRFGARYDDKKTHYLNEEGVDQLQNVINLIKTDPSSRRIILSAWNPIDLSSMALPPCHVMIQFYIDGKYLDAQMYQRSGDMFLGVPFNIASYSLLMYIIGSITGYEPRYFHHILGDAHIYINHINPIGEQLMRIPVDFPNLILKNKIDNIDNIDEDNFVLENYNYYPSIKAEMIA